MPEAILREYFLKHIRLIRVLVILATIVVIVSSSSKMIRSPLAKGDTSVYTYAAEVILRGENIYATTQIPASQGGSYYLYLPLLAILFIPLSFLPINVVIVLWCAFNVFLIFWIVKTFYEAIAGDSLFSLPVVERWIVMFFPILLSSRFLLNHLAYGQANILVLAMLVVALKYGRGANGLLQGLWAGLAGVVKITAAPFIFWLFIKENAKTKLGLAMGCVLGAILIPGLVLGFGTNSDYLSFWLNNIVLGDKLTSTHVPSSINTSITALLNRFFGDWPALHQNGDPVFFTVVKLSPDVISLLSRASQLIVLMVIALYVFIFRDRDDIYSRWGGAALAFTMIPLFAPTAQKHYFVMLLPAYVFAIYVWHFLRNSDRLFRWLVVSSAVIAGIGGQDLFGETFSDAAFAAGALPLGSILLAAAVFRAASNNVVWANTPRCAEV